MGLITQETAAAIWRAYREIESGRKLLEDMEKEYAGHDMDKTAPALQDAFGQRRHLQLGVPSGRDSHRLLDVHPTLARAMIVSHIERKRVELFEANEVARAEMAAEA